MELNEIDIDTSSPDKQLFYIGIASENNHILLEKDNRGGYTSNIDEAGMYNTEQARNVTKHLEACGYLRFAIPVEVIQSLASSIQEHELETMLAKIHYLAKFSQMKSTACDFLKKAGEEFAIGNDKKAEWFRELANDLKLEAEKSKCKYEY